MTDVQPAGPRPRSRAHAVVRFFRTPKGILTVILAAFAGLSAPTETWRLVAPSLAAAIAAAVAIDIPMLRLRSHRWHFPSGAVLSALLVAMVLSPHEPVYVPAAAAALAVSSKYVFRYGKANLFNPAALALVAAFYIFGTGQNWWGALPEVTPFALVLLVGAGVFMASRVNKLPMVLAFLGVYFLLFTVTAFAGDPAGVAEVFRPPDLHAALFFAFFFLTDPPTSPVRYRDQVLCASIVAAAGYAIFEGLGAAHYLLAGVLVGNLWEAWRRSRDAAYRRARLAGHRVSYPAS